MKINEATWSEAADWFDRLAGLTSSERDRILAGRVIAPEVRRLLDELLTAHDDADTALIDRTIHRLAGDLLEDQGFEPPPDDWAGIEIGHWRVVEELQRGGMATVVLAERSDGQYERRVALKVLHAARGDRDSDRSHRRSLEHELRLLAGLAHPGIVHLLDGGVSEEGWPYLVMEFVQGEPIDAWCDRTDASLETRIELLSQVASAVAHAHARLVIHADLKPSNVLVNVEGRARLVDFGIARLVDRDDEARTRFRLHCSPAWAAPEQLAGEAPRVATDIHGLGMLMYRLLAGRPPRSTGAATRALLGRRVAPSPGRPSAAPETPFPARRLRGDLDAICLHATSEDPEQRYRSAEAFERDLAAWQAQRPVLARNPSASDRLWKWVRRNRGVAMAGVLAMVSLIGGTAVATWQAVRAQQEAAASAREAERAETIKEFLVTMLTAADPWQAGGHELDMRDVLRQGSLQIETDASLDPSTRTELLLTLGDVQTALGWHDEAARDFQRAEALLDRHAELPDRLRARLWLERAVLEGARKNYLAQLPLLDRMRAVVPASDDPESRRLQLQLWVETAGVHANLNRPDDFDDALGQAEAVLAGLSDPPLGALRDLEAARVSLAYNQGDLQTAYEAALSTLDIQRRMGNEEAANMVTTLSNLAATAAQLGRLDEALEHDRAAVALAVRAYPDGHPEIARARYALGDTLRQRGRFDAALEELGRARAGQARPELAVERALTDLTRSRTLLALGRGAEAARAAAEARGVLAEAWGPTTAAVLQLFDVELAGRWLAGEERALDIALERAGDRLEQVPSPARWQSLAQALRWRMGLIALHRGDQDTARGWLDESDTAPDDIVRHPSTSLRQLGLRLRLTDDRAIGAGLIERIEREQLDPAAADDARAYALCSVLIYRTRQSDGEIAALRARLDALADNGVLSYEGRADADCAEARAPAGEAGVTHRR